MKKGENEDFFNFDAVIEIEKKKSFDRAVDDCIKLVDGILKYYRDEFHFGVTFNCMCNTIVESLDQLKGEKV